MTLVELVESNHPNPVVTLLDNGVYLYHTKSEEPGRVWLSNYPQDNSYRASYIGGVYIGEGETLLTKLDLHILGLVTP